MTSTSELFALMTLGSIDAAMHKKLPELAKVALVMVRVLVVIRLIITAVTLTLPRAATSRRVPFWYHNTSGVGNPLALQMSIPSSKRDIFLSTGSSSRMGFTGGVGRGDISRLQKGHFVATTPAEETCGTHHAIVLRPGPFQLHY